MVTYQAHRQSVLRQQLQQPDHLQHRASCSSCCCPSSSLPTGSPPGRGSHRRKERQGEHRSPEEEARCIRGQEEVRRMHQLHQLHRRRRRRQGRHRSQSLHHGCRRRKDGRHTQAERGCGWEHPTGSGRSSRRSTTAGAAQTRLAPTGWARGRGRKTHSCWWQEARGDARHTGTGCRTAVVVAGMEAAVRSPGAAVRSLLRRAAVVAGRRAAVHRRGSAKGEGTGCRRTGPEEGSLQRIWSASSQEEPWRAAHNGAVNGGGAGSLN